MLETPRAFASAQQPQQKIDASRLVDAFLAFACSTVVWVVCIATPILASVACAVPILAVLAIWDALTSMPAIDRLTPVLAVVTTMLLTGLLMPVLSKAVLRVSLRLSPLPIARSDRAAIPAILWISWLVFLVVLILGGSEWLTVVVAFAVGAGGFARVYHFRRGWEGLPAGRTVLFLRRFGRTADRLVSSAIRRALPRDVSLVFLVGERQGIASWDPVVVAFDGLRRGLPQYLQSTDDQWVAHVTQLVRHADAVVLDATDWSDAMATELAIVQSCGASDRLTVLMREKERPEAADDTRRLHYRASWRQASGRMFWGGFLTLFPAVIASDMGSPREVSIALTIAAVVAWALLVVRPLMDPAAAEALTRRLHDVVAVDRRARPPI
jgi:hypothetical protein